MAQTVITMLAEKGGVGKTTNVINAATVLASRGYRVLTIDLDKQGNLTKFFLGVVGFENIPKDETVAALFDERYDPDPHELVTKTKIENLFLVPSTRQLKHHLYVDQATFSELRFSLRDFLDEVAEAFDFVVIDTPPDIDSLATQVALLGSQFVVTPVEPEVFSAQGVRGGDIVITQAQEENPGLRFLGYVINKLDKRRSDHELFESKLRNLHNDQVFDTALRRLGSFAQAQALSKPVTVHDPKSDAAKLAVEFVDEILERMKRVGHEPALSGRTAA